MALPLKSLPTGGFFNPDKTGKSAAAILVEVTNFERQRPGKYGPKDTADCTVTIFETKEDLAAGKASILQGTQIAQSALARDCGSVGVGGAFVATLGTVPGQGNNDCWVWREITDAGVVSAIEAYAEKRDAKLAEAKASAPSFD